MDQKEYKEQLEQQEKLLNKIEDQIAKASNPDQYTGTITGFIWPCPDYPRITDYFGSRPQPVPGASTNHKGVDLAAHYGSVILASASGERGENRHCGTVKAFRSAGENHS